MQGKQSILLPTPTSQGKETMWDKNGHLDSVQLQSEGAQRKRKDLMHLGTRSEGL